jgi:hypothetical protein
MTLCNTLHWQSTLRKRRVCIITTLSDGITAEPSNGGRGSIWRLTTKIVPWNSGTQDEGNQMTWDIRRLPEFEMGAYRESALKVGLGALWDKIYLRPND